MPVFVAALGRLLMWVAGSIIGKIVLGFGLGFVAYKGIDVMMTELQTFVNAQIGGTDPIYAQYFDAFGFNTAIQLICSAYVARFGTQTAYKLIMSKAAT